MRIWQADIYRRPLRDEAGNSLWEVVICEGDRALLIAACPQPSLSSAWLTAQITTAINLHGQPDRLQVFRPQSLSLLETACQSLGLSVEATRHTPHLHALLEQRALDYPHLPNYTGEAYDPVALDRPPPLPLADNLWGESWRFAAIAASDLDLVFGDRPIPIRVWPETLTPQTLKLASTTMVPGVIIYGGRQSMRLARWLEQADPVSLHYIPGAPDGLILEAGLVDRWILTTFDDPEAIAAGQTYQQRLQTSQGLHFLLVQPDDSGVTYTALWLLQTTT
ncbi:MAG: Tab2/Atab2 family RNA-binding protein [Synechococcales cyanobacterium K44_A2020_017]|nr:Tab2/Atab2 family RNA-binding protein [Synechococcales cyanobacterium K32_A2020_035]MBF2095587.1 Tab2/Atab2 family RNA-binding protein [Synechococcales cyanobacterium K44_A2020_017]